MEKERTAPCVHYAAGDGSVSLEKRFDGETTTQKFCQQQNTRNGLGTLMLLLKILLPVCLIIMGAVATFFLFRHADNASTLEMESSYSLLPDVLNLSLLSMTNSTFTVTWDRPKANFHYYKVEVFQDSNGSSQPLLVGSCASGTILHPDQKEITCSHIAACKETNFTLRTYSSGPPEIISQGATIHSIYTIAESLDPPTNVTTAYAGAFRSRLLWYPPADVAGVLGPYTVNIWMGYSLDDHPMSRNPSRKKETSETWLEFENYANTFYCVEVTASARCHENHLISFPAKQQFWTLRSDFFAAHKTTSNSTVEITITFYNMVRGLWKQCTGNVQCGETQSAFSCDNAVGRKIIITLTGLNIRTFRTCEVTLSNDYYNTTLRKTTDILPYSAHGSRYHEGNEDSEDPADPEGSYGNTDWFWRCTP